MKALIHWIPNPHHFHSLLPTPRTKERFSFKLHKSILALRTIKTLKIDYLRLCSGDDGFDSESSDHDHDHHDPAPQTLPAQLDTFESNLNEFKGEKKQVEDKNSMVAIDWGDLCPGGSRTFLDWFGMLVVVVVVIITMIGIVADCHVDQTLD